MHGASDLQNGTVVAQNMGFGVAAEKKYPLLPNSFLVLPSYTPHTSAHNKLTKVRTVNDYAGDVCNSC